jgi:hypothetical protein
MDSVCDVDILGVHRFLNDMVICGKGAGMESSGAVAHDAVRYWILSNHRQNESHHGKYLLLS